MKLKIPPPLYLITTAIIIWVLKNYYPINLLDIRFSSYLGIALIITGGLIDAWSLRLFIQSKTTVNPLQPQKANSLVTVGVYQFTRNPMYLGMLLMLTGWCFYLGAVSGFLLLPLFIWILTTVQIIPEEQALEKKFGDTYLQYKSTVRRWV